jgi:hypothetical protein
MTATNPERVRLSGWVALDVALLVLFALAAAVCWAIQPLALLVLPVPFAFVFVIIAVLSDRWEDNARS